MILKKVICYVYDFSEYVPYSWIVFALWNRNEISPLVFLQDCDSLVVCLQNAKIGESHHPETSYMMGS